MVGKGEVKSSRIFQQCYVKCCKLQNLTPLSSVIPSGNGKLLDFCVDRIKYVDWPPILNALSCDLSLHSVAIKCRQQVKTVLEHVDCERLAKTVNKRAVILTNFMLSNLVEATAQLLANTTLLTALLLEGLPLKIPYLNPLCEALLANSSLQHLYLPRCLVGDAGCQALCKAVRCLPNILTLDLSACELTALGAGYIADLLKVLSPQCGKSSVPHFKTLLEAHWPVTSFLADELETQNIRLLRCLIEKKYQKIHRYSENWVHTLRYRLPELDAMAGLRRITLCANPQLGDAGVGKLFEVLADDLWIKALDVQNCGVSEDCAAAALRMMSSNTTLVVLDLRNNPQVSAEAVVKLRAALRQNERGLGVPYSWLSISGSSSDGRSVKIVPSKNAMIKDRGVSNVRNAPNKYLTKTNTVKKEREYTEVLEEQLQEEISHRQQLEELNLQLVEQMKRLKQHHIQLWGNGAGATSSGSEQSLEASSRSGDLSSSSGSASSVPIDQNTLSYIQQAFKDIYAFIKNNQCNGQCLYDKPSDMSVEHPIEDIQEVRSSEEQDGELRINIAKKAQSSHMKLVQNIKKRKITKSAHLLGDFLHARRNIDAKPEVIERHIGDTKDVNEEERTIMDEIIAHTKGSKPSYERGSSCGSVSDSSDTLVYSPQNTQRSVATLGQLPPNPRDALCSSSDEDE